MTHSTVGLRFMCPQWPRERRVYCIDPRSESCSVSSTLELTVRTVTHYFLQYGFCSFPIAKYSSVRAKNRQRHRAAFCSQ